jgi:hypothetical protein
MISNELIRELIDAAIDFAKDSIHAPLVKFVVVALMMLGGSAFANEPPNPPGFQREETTIQ